MKTQASCAAFSRTFPAMVVLLVGLSGTCNAEIIVQEIGENVDSTIYVYLNTARRNGSMVKMWSLYNYKKAKRKSGISKPYLSAKTQDEYDCGNELVRSLAYSFHSEALGGGEVLYSYSGLEKWKPMAPESPAKALWQIACATK